MQFEWVMIPYSLLTLFIVVNYGMLLTAFMQKIGARVGRRHGIPIWQNYFDLIKNFGIRSSITHGTMFYLGPVFRLTGGIGLLLFVPTIFGSEMFSNLSFAGDLILARLAEDGYHEEGRFHVLDPTKDVMNRKVVWSYPAFALRSVFARNDQELVRVNLGIPK